MIVYFHQRNEAAYAKARLIPRMAGFIPVNGRKVPVNDLKTSTLFFGLKAAGRIILLSNWFSLDIFAGIYSPCLKYCLKSSMKK
jgi:hypothetical protein